MVKIINLSESVLIALHGLIIIAQQAPDLVRANEISKVTRSSKNTIAKVMQQLSKAELVHSTRGLSGGFSLSKDPDTISLLHIYEVIEGQLVMNKCPFKCKTCIFGECIFGGLIDKMTSDFKEELNKKTIADMCNFFWII